MVDLTGENEDYRVTTKRLIAGAGGFGREVRALIEEATDLEVLGFLDDRPPASDGSGPALGAAYLGVVDGADCLDVPCVVAVGYPQAKRGVIDAMVRAGRPLAPALVHPRAEVGSGVALSDGVIITAGVVTTTDIVLGRCVSLHPGALLGHDVVCEDLVAVMPGAAVSGNVHLGEGAFVGTSAAILQGVRVGAWATIGAGAVVTRDVPAGATVVGVPAQVVGADLR